MCVQAFEWVVRDVSRLRDHIEGVSAPVGEGDAPPEEIDDDEFEVLRESPELGDGKFKLEICTFSLLPGGRHNKSDRTATAAAKTTLNDPDSSSAPSTPIIRTQPPTLSVYITSMAIDFAHTDYETSASMFAAIKCQDDRVGERGARAEWAWEHWQSNFVFRQGSEVWGEWYVGMQRCDADDGFVLCLRMPSASSFCPP